MVHLFLWPLHPCIYFFQVQHRLSSVSQIFLMKLCKVAKVAWCHWWPSTSHTHSIWKSLSKLSNLNSYSIKITYFWHKNVKQTWSHLNSKKKVVIDTISMSFSTIVRTTTYRLNLKFAITANVIIRYPSHHRPPPLATAIDWLLSGWFLTAISFAIAVLEVTLSFRLSLQSALLSITE